MKSDCIDALTDLGMEFAAGYRNPRSQWHSLIMNCLAVHWVDFGREVSRCSATTLDKVQSKC